MVGKALLLLKGLKVLIIMTSLQNTISGAQGLLMSMGLKCLIMMTRAQNIKIPKPALLGLIRVRMFMSTMPIFKTEALCLVT